MTNVTDPESHHSFVISIAKEAIECRAAREGHEPGTYDAKEDSEGYIVSILNALHQWCHEHDLDWESELECAQSYFLENLDLPDTPATIEGMACPKCGHQDSFYVEVHEVLLRFANGDVLPDDNAEQWDNASYCSCYACTHAGRVYQFRTDIQPDKEKTYG